MPQLDIHQVSAAVELMQRHGASPEEVDAALAEAGWTTDQYVAQVNRLLEAGGSFRKQGPIEGAVGAFAQGATLGFGDEVAGGIQALIDKARGAEAPLGDLYRQSRAKADLAGAQYARENPNTAALASGTGAATTAFLPGGPASTLMRTGASPVMRVGGAALGGGVAGSAAAAGSAQPGERTDAAYAGAIQGAGAGAALGGAAEVAGPLFGAMKAPVERLADYVRGVVGGRGATTALGRGTGSATGSIAAPGASDGAVERAMGSLADRRAADKILQGMERDGTRPLDVLGSLQSSRQAGTPMQLAEALEPGGSAQGLARATVTLPGQGRVLSQGGLGAPAQPGAQRARIERELEALAGRPAPSPDELAADILARRGRRGADYRNLSEQTGDLPGPGILPGFADSDLVARLESRPIYREAWERDNASRTRVGDALPPLFGPDGRVARAPRIEDVQSIKSQLDAEVYGAQGMLTPETARARTDVGRVEVARRELVAEADLAAPGYKPVRQAAGTDFEVEKAAELAKDITRMSPQEVRAFLAEASADAAGTFRAQAMLALKDRLLEASGRGKYPSLVREVWENGDGKMRAVMKEVFGGDARKFSAFEAAMNRELRKAETRNFMWGGSNTANKLAEVQDLQGDNFEAVAAQLAWGGPKAAATGAVASKLAGFTGRTQAGFLESTRDAVARRMFMDPAESSDEFLRLLEKIRQERLAAQRNFQPTAGASVVAGAQSVQPQAGP